MPLCFKSEYTALIFAHTLSMFYLMKSILWQEQPDDKENMDDDEEKKHPAYVPRKGAFYEHDLRLGDDDVPGNELK